MPAGFLETFTEIGRLAYPIVQRGVREQLTTTAIIDVLKAGGLSFRRTDMLRMVRLERGIEETSSRLRFVALDKRPDPSRLKEAAGRMRRQFSFVVEVEGRDMLTDSVLKRHVTISTDSLLTRAEIEAAAMETLEEDEYAEEFEAQKPMLVRGVKAGVFGTL